ncbi:hypothetical protein QS257_19930 [Terrilactibacillus sp. S3-3]|nr:hypothetical protein QS257_19930 [Terrilactibacillus sp. S3-3]
MLFERGKLWHVSLRSRPYQPIDILKDREKETVTQWLNEHPEVLMVSRDRSSTYRQAIDVAQPHCTSL